MQLLATNSLDRSAHFRYLGHLPPPDQAGPAHVHPVDDRRDRGAASHLHGMPSTLFLTVLIIVGTVTPLKPTMGAADALRFAPRLHRVGAVLIGLFVGAYYGLLGPGTFFAFVLDALLGHIFVAASAKSGLVNLATNLAALVVCIPQGVAMCRIGLFPGARQP